LKVNNFGTRENWGKDKRTRERPERRNREKKPCN